MAAPTTVREQVQRLGARRAVVIPAGARRRARLIRRVGRWAITVESLLVFLFLYVPILILVIYSFNASRFSSVWSGFTLDWYRSLLTPGATLSTEGANEFTSRGVIAAFQNSLIVAAVSTLIATILGTMVALALSRYRFRGKRLLDVLLYLPIIIPEITMGISLLVFFSLLFRLVAFLFGGQWTLGLPTIIIGHVAFNIPFVAVVVRARLADFPHALDEAAADLGATPWRTFWEVTFPLILPGIIGGALLAFTLSLDDFVITFFTAGVGSTTLPIFVYGMIKFSITPTINAISTLMLVASVILVIGSLLLQRRAAE
ncbi:MAG: ABC transporter permease [Ardenticatenaceae bacterium]|nr:ABC transporter permease [Ardenticatenaceae bacterium]